MASLSPTRLFLSSSSQLPEPIWAKEEEALFNWYKERDLPVPIGGNWNFVKKEKRVARW